MSDGPSDFDSGYFFESQKGISDRRRALGLDQGPTRSSTRIGDERSRSAGGGHISGSSGGGLIHFIFTAMFYLAIGAIWLSWQMLKIVFAIMGALLSRF